VIRLADGKVVGDERIEHPIVAGTPRPSEVALEEETHKAATATPQPELAETPNPGAPA
jgi:hypothetical protein